MDGDEKRCTGANKLVGRKKKGRRKWERMDLEL